MKPDGRDDQNGRVSELIWTSEPLTLVLTHGDGPVTLTDIRWDALNRAARPDRAHQPLVEIASPDTGSGTFSNTGRWTGTEIGSRLRYVSHRESADALVVEQVDAETGVRAVTTLRSRPGIAAVTATTAVSLEAGREPVRLWGVTSLATGAVISDEANHLDVWTGASTWAAEHRWSNEPLRAPGLARIDAGARGETINRFVGRTSHSTKSSEGWVPAGVAVDRETGVSLAWQIEHNGGWHWEIGERSGPGRGGLDALPVGADEPHGYRRPDTERNGVYLSLLGPEQRDHAWAFELTSEAGFETVPVTIGVGASRDDALGALADHRRAARRPHPQNTALPVIFNDYMDTLNGDPTEAKLLPLIDAAATVGCEMFCIDAGWYDDTAGWWASVGDWQPSTVRFPRGLSFVLDHIREQGMVAGLWLEPEVVGTTSAIASELPDEAFLQRDGRRICELSRYFLDLRHPAARAHLDASVDRLVGELGVGMFKFDHNVVPGVGTDVGGPSLGHNLLEQNRAVLSWLDGLLDRHPDLVIENCASGAMRSDFAMLSRLALQSTSDQEDPLLYPAIAVGALAHIGPEQAGNWAYPQPEMSDERIIWTQLTGLAGRVYQAGLVDRLSDGQRALVKESLDVHKATRGVIAASRPRFPLGLPTWDSDWIAVEFDGDERYLLVWRHAHADASVEIPVGAGSAEQIYPAGGAAWTTDASASSLRLTCPVDEASARMFRLT